MGCGICRCRPLAEDQDASRRQAGLAALVAFKHLLLPLKNHSPDAALQVAEAGDFWQLLQNCLVGLFCSFDGCMHQDACQLGCSELPQACAHNGVIESLTSNMLCAFYARLLLSWRGFD